MLLLSVAAVMDTGAYIVPEPTGKVKAVFPILDSGELIKLFAEPPLIEEVLVRVRTALELALMILP